MTRIDKDKGIDMFAKFSLLSSRQLDQSDYDGDCEGDNGDMGAKMFTQETISPAPPWHCARKYLPLSSLDMWDSVEKKKKITGTKSRQIIISCHLQQFLRHENQCRLQQNVQDVGETNI